MVIECGEVTKVATARGRTGRCQIRGLGTSNADFTINLPEKQKFGKTLL